jgi:putative ABC transport system substrate-binding protein
MMNRRRFVMTTVAGALAAPRGAEGQPAGKVYRIGWMASSPNPTFGAFLLGLREHGFVEGQNIVFERRYSEGQETRHTAFAEELARMKVDAIVAVGSPPAHAAKRATSTIPIVMVAAANPEKQGLVTSLARPGGNITGTSNQGLEASGKMFQVMKDVLPRLSKIAVMWHPGNPASTTSFKEGDVPAARALGVSLLSLEVQEPEDVERAFATMKRDAPDVLWVHVSLSPYRTRILELVATHRIPSGAFARAWAEGGGLISYGPSVEEMFRRSAVQVAKILKGAKPADLPVEQPTKFELAINLKTAKALGLTIPASVLLRADRVIE